MTKKIFLCILIYSYTSFAQLNDSISYAKIKYSTIGLNSDVNNSLFGFLISNGVEEKPLLHFEDINNNLLYKFYGQTNFDKNYSVGTTLAWNSPSKQLSTITVTLLGIDYLQREIKEDFFLQKKLNLFGEFYLKDFSISILTKTGLNQINSSNNLGGEIGFRKTFKNMYVGGYAGKYSEKSTFNVYAQSNLYKNKIFTRFTFDNIGSFNSLNVGLHYMFDNFSE